MSRATGHDAVLLMESHGLSPNARSSLFASTQVWSKLYQAGPYFVDLGLRPDDRGVSLRGEIMTETGAPPASGGRVTLFDWHGKVIGSTDVGAECAGSEFLFEIGRADNYRLEIALDGEILRVSDLQVG